MIGNPVHHTLSPAIHNTLNDLAKGKPANYNNVYGNSVEKWGVFLIYHELDDILSILLSIKLEIIMPIFINASNKIIFMIFDFIFQIE